MSIDDENSSTILSRFLILIIFAIIYLLDPKTTDKGQKYNTQKETF